MKKVIRLTESDLRRIVERVIMEQTPGTPNTSVPVDGTKRMEIYNQDVAKWKQLFPYSANQKNLLTLKDYIKKERWGTDQILKKVYTPYAETLKAINPGGYNTAVNSNWDNYEALFLSGPNRMRTSASPIGTAELVINDLITACNYMLAMIKSKNEISFDKNTYPPSEYLQMMKVIAGNQGIKL